MDTFNFNLLNLKKVKSFADIGCGNGRHLKSLSSKLHTCNLIGVDHSCEEISKLNSEFTNNICKNQNSYKFVEGDIRDLNIDSSSQDLVICSEVLEHVPNFEKVLQECKRILKPNGVLLISVPSYLPERICWLFSKEYQQTPGGHIRIFTKSFLQEAFRKQELKVFKKHKQHAFHSLYWIIRSRNKMNDSKFLKSFHELLVKQMFGQAIFSANLEKLINPLFGKSVCFYLKK
tara:strand:- start:403 stop:1098 length:696 start_codon:yes stop_codon:yes gene_type:complete